jgi:plastocyanin
MRLHAILITAMVCVVLNTPSSHAKTVSVSVVSEPLRFDPATVDANPGDTVTWTNTTKIDHTISPDTDGAFPEKDPLSPNETYSITLPADASSGPIPYHCNFHPMNAIINVVKPSR